MASTKSATMHMMAIYGWQQLCLLGGRRGNFTMLTAQQTNCNFQANVSKLHPVPYHLLSHNFLALQGSIHNGLKPDNVLMKDDTAVSGSKACPFASHLDASLKSVTLEPGKGSHVIPLAIWP